MRLADLLLWMTVLLPTVCAVGLAGRLAWMQRRHAELGWELAEAQSERQEAIVARARSVQRAELARELHDLLGHRLTLLAVQTGALEVQAPTELVPRLAGLRLGVAEAVEALNRSVNDLGAPAADEAVTLENLLATVARDVSSAGAQVETQIDASDVPIPLHLAKLTEAIVREGLTNVLKHASGATARIRASITCHSLDVCVTNARVRGTPRTMTSGGNGIAGLGEQVTRAGGELTARPSSEGWTLHAALPLMTEQQLDVAARRMRLNAVRRRSVRRLISVPVVTLFLLLLAPALAVIGRAGLSHLSRADFGAIELEGSESAARERLPLMTMEAAPATVGSGDCRHYESTFSPFDRTDVFEVCFQDGRVVSKTVITAP